MGLGSESCSCRHQLFPPSHSRPGYGNGMEWWWWWYLCVWRAAAERRVCVFVGMSWEWTLDWNKGPCLFLFRQPRATHPFCLWIKWMSLVLEAVSEADSSAPFHRVEWGGDMMVEEALVLLPMVYFQIGLVLSSWWTPTTPGGPDSASPVLLR
jgi:hypothetical protein